jgi:hypothetical protein
VVRWREPLDGSWVSSSFGIRSPNGRTRTTGRGSGYFVANHEFVRLVSGLLHATLDEHRKSAITNVELQSFLGLKVVQVTFADGWRWSLSPTSRNRQRILEQLGRP